ncbi:MAG: prepilin-type N-terminal cleavage/methylation domain-containing protein [Thermodesulfobacteriota bacterium]
MDSRKRQQGFTLIEIIAVIVLLGVLAAVLVPKFTNLTQDAKVAALQQAIAEGQARVNAASAKFILATGAVPATLTALEAHTAVGSIDTAAGDYSLAFAATTVDTLPGAQVSATDKDGNSATGFAAFPKQ